MKTTKESLLKGIREFLLDAQYKVTDGNGRVRYACRVCREFVYNPNEDIKHREDCPIGKLQELVK